MKWTPAAVLGAVIQLLLSGCQTLTPEQACHYMQWGVAERARAGVFRDVEIGPCTGFETNTERGVGSVVLEATYERNPGKAESYLTDRWEPARKRIHTSRFVKTDQGWRPAAGSWPPSGRRTGSLSLAVERIGVGGATPADGGRCSVDWASGARPAPVSVGFDGRCTFVGIRAGDILSVSAEVTDSWGRRHLVPVRATDLDGPPVSIQVFADPAVRIRIRDGLADRDGLDATVEVDGEPMTTTGGSLTLPSIPPGTVLSLAAWADGYVRVDETVSVQASPPWTQDVTLDLLPVIPAETPILAVDVQGQLGEPRSRRLPVDLRKAFGMDFMQPRVHLSASAVRQMAWVTRSPLVVVRGRVARRTQVLDPSGPTVPGAGGTGLASTVTGWVLLPVAEWTGGVLPADRFDLRARRVSMPAGAIIGARSVSLANSVWSVWPPVSVDWEVASLEPEPRFVARRVDSAGVFRLPEEGLWALCDGIDGDFVLLRYEEP